MSPKLMVLRNTFKCIESVEFTMIPSLCKCALHMGILILLHKYGEHMVGSFIRLFSWLNLILVILATDKCVNLWNVRFTVKYKRKLTSSHTVLLYAIVSLEKNLYITFLILSSRNKVS